MEKVDRWNTKLINVIAAAAPLAVLRPVITDAAREILLKQAQENLSKLQTEWNKKCVFSPFQIMPIILRATQVGAVGAGFTPIIAAKRDNVDWQNTFTISMSVFTLSAGTLVAMLTQ